MFGSTGLLAQQTDASPPKRSLADGIVRHRIEVDRLAPPHLLSGVEIGTGEGPMVLLVRNRDGTLHATELQRGPGKHGEAAEIAKLRAVLEEPETEEGKEAGTPPPDAVTAKIRIERSGKEIVATPAAKAALPKFDREHLRPTLASLLAATQGQPHANQLEIEVGVGVPLQDVLVVWEVAWEAGFRVPLFGETVPSRPAAAVIRDQIAGLPAQFGWEGRRLPDLPMPLHDAEVLVLFDGPTPFAEFAQLLRECTKNGIWQLSLVGQQDAKTRWKLATHLAMCR